MILADTSIWIDFLRAKSLIASHMQRKLEEGQIISMGCIFGELLQGVRSQREADVISEYWTPIPKVNEENIWLDAGLYAYKNKLLTKGVGLIDAAIAVAVQRSQALLWTHDQKLLSVLKKIEIYIV